MAGPRQSPLVHLKDGAVRGTVRAGVTAFLGIPYAAPPFGANRMRPPQPVQPWEGERDATSYGPTVPKGDYPPQYAPLFPEVVIPGEDCLNLNIWTPDPGAAGLPVLVWIHGGSFTNGSGSVGEYDGSGVRPRRRGVRDHQLPAGRRGLPLPRATASPTSACWISSRRCEWVQENIAVFGGDPARVTVAGESAGAMSVTTLLSMPRRRGMFGQAIAQSGAAAHTLYPRRGLEVSGYLAEALGVPADRDSIKAVPLERLVQAASDLVVEVQTTPIRRWGKLALNLLPFAPTVDGVTLPRTAGGDRRRAGRDVALLIGRTVTRPGCSWSRRVPST